MTTTRKTRQPVKALNQSSAEVAAAAATDKARKAASRKALKDAKVREAHEANLDVAQREIDARSAEGEDMTGAVIDQTTYAIIKPAPVESSHADQDAANALRTAIADAETMGVPLERMLAEMGIDDQGRPLQSDDKQRYNGPMLALVAARKHYAKAANGILCNGDQLATICGAHSRDETVKALGTLLFSKGLIASTNPYASLNPGQQSMNLRNKARHALKAGSITFGDVKAAYAA